MQDHLGALFGDHQRWAVGVAGGYARHDRGVRDAQAAHALHPETGIDRRIRAFAHTHGADGMEDRRRDIPRSPGEVFVAVDMGAGLELFRAVALQRRLAGDFTGQAHRLRGDQTIGRV